MKDKNKLIEFLCVEIYNATNCLPIALTPESQIDRIALLTEIKGIVEQSEIKPLKISKSQGKKIMRKVQDFNRRKLAVDEIADKKVEEITTGDCFDYVNARIGEILHKHKDGGDFDDTELRTLNHIRILINE